MKWKNYPFQEIFDFKTNAFAKRESGWMMRGHLYTVTEATGQSKLGVIGQLKAPFAL